MIDSFASGYDGEIGTIEYGDGFAHFKIEIIVGIDVGHSRTSHPYITRLLEIDQCVDQFASHSPVAGQTNGHARECAQHGNIVERMVGSTESTECPAAANTEK